MSVTSDRVADVADRRADVRVSGAAAEIPAHPFGDLRVGRSVPLLEQGDRGHQLAGRAEAALEGVVGDEGALHGMKLLVLGKTLDRGHLTPLACDRERQAGEDATPIDVDRARAAG